MPPSPSMLSTSRSRSTRPEGMVTSSGRRRSTEILGSSRKVGLEASDDTLGPRPARLRKIVASTDPAL